MVSSEKKVTTIVLCRRTVPKWKKAFFSEEKKQKTFTSSPLPRSRPQILSNGPGSINERQNKSLFASFSSEKEDSSFLISLRGTNPHPNPPHKKEGTAAVTR
jgi:hypothetical protein